MMKHDIDAAKMLKGFYRHFQSKAADSKEKIREGADSAIEIGFERGIRYAAATLKDAYERITSDDIDAED